MFAHVPSFGQNPRVSPDFLAYPVAKTCMHVLGTGVPRCLGIACSASSPKATQALECSLTPGLRISLGRVPACHGLPQCPGYGHWVSYCCVALVFASGSCLGSGFGCTPPLLAEVLGSVSACVRAPLVPRHSWLGCAVWVCGFGLEFPLRPATPGWAVGLCSVLVCTLRLYPATPGWGVRCGCVCFGSRFACAPAPLAGVLVCVCVLVCAPRLYPATPGWGVRRVRVCPWARVSAAPRHSWLGCWGVCVFLCY